MSKRTKLRQIFGDIVRLVGPKTTSLSHQPATECQTQCGNMALLTSLKNGTFATLSDTQAIQLFGIAFEWELNRLKHAKSTVESTGTPTQGSLGDGELTPSRLLFQDDYVEVNRTLVGMLALKWLIAKDYESFTRFQNAARKLQQESFRELHQLLVDNLPNTEDIYSLLVAIVVNDLGKDDSLEATLPKISGRTYENHDEILLAAANAELIPSVNSLASDLKLDFMLGLEIGSKLNLAQLAQAENVPASLQSIHTMRGKRRAFFLKYMEVLLDIAGAAGHIDSRCAKQMTEPVFQSFLAVKDGLVAVIEDNFSLQQGYDCVLDARARILQDDGFRKLSTGIAIERSQLRLLAMGRVSDAQLAGCFIRAFEELPVNIRNSLVEGLSIDGLVSKPAILPYYAPGLIAEALRNCADEPMNLESRILAISAMMRFLARVYDETKADLDAGKVAQNNVIQIDLSFAHTLVASEEFKANPAVLDTLLISR